MRFQHLEWLFPIVVTLHNAEEAIWFPAWEKQNSRWHASVGSSVFWMGTGLLPILAFGFTGLSVHFGPRSAWTYLTFGYMASMLGNVFLSHVLFAVAPRRYVPGLRRWVGPARFGNIDELGAP
jgi:hypothetical protein